LDYKAIADTLASGAAFVAIVAALHGWYQSARRPLKISRVIVHQKASESNFIIEVENVKPYPVTIKAVDCYRGKRFRVKKTFGGRLVYHELFPISEQIFSDRVECEISANGHKDVRVSSSRQSNIPCKLLFLLDTSHGYHELCCNKVAGIDIDCSEWLEYKYDYSSKLPAKIRYVWERAVELIKRCTRMLRRR